MNTLKLSNNKKIIKSECWKMHSYNGWKNYYTWNVMLFIENDEGLYNLVQAWKKQVINNPGKCGFNKSYKSLLICTNLMNARTPDGVAFNNRNISRREIINAIFEE